MRIVLFWLGAFALGFAGEIYASFSVEARMQSKLTLEAVGIVKDLRVQVGDRVKRGEILLSLDDESERLALENAKNDYNLALSEFKNAQSKMQKFQAVREVIDKQSYEDVQTALTLSKLRLEKARLGVRHYQNLREKKQLKAPYDAIIANKFVQVGEGARGVGEVLVEVFSYPEVKLVLSFDEKYKDAVKIGQTFLYKLDGSDEEFRGKIALIHPSIEEKTRKIYAEVHTQNLTPGLFGEGKILTDE
ncbi:efflux RND transporter periplasmic adaptor subunit [Campylobacter sp.]|uniref:efflux RND transporter periplasmic adaptor subunit n=1 Tax=Campylobacter sp. TaxID=205 RepID=UPI0026DABA76|nr:efflux RND transporter periplasmic adaptor subunit [Campylobacter sp.]MDO4674836.1 efflux RND transporter periplasmic adaptor subunit [Campylobacter sp.]